VDVLFFNLLPIFFSILFFSIFIFLFFHWWIRLFADTVKAREVVRVNVQFVLGELFLKQFYLAGIYSIKVSVIIDHINLEKCAFRLERRVSTVATKLQSFQLCWAKIYQ
jgi:hypothetical protein